MGITRSIISWIVEALRRFLCVVVNWLLDLMEGFLELVLAPVQALFEAWEVGSLLGTLAEPLAVVDLFFPVNFALGVLLALMFAWILNRLLAWVRGR